MLRRLLCLPPSILLACCATPPPPPPPTSAPSTPTLSATERCLRQIENGPRVVKAAALALERHRAETGHYPPDLETAAFSHSATALYAVKVAHIEEGNFEVVADGLGDAVGDQWTMDRSFRSRHTKTAPCEALSSSSP